MSKKRKKSIYFMPLVVFMIYFVYSCTNEYFETLSVERKETKRQLLEEARRMYYSTIPDEGLIELRSSSLEAEDLMIKPSWEHARVEEDSRYQIAEFLLIAEKRFSYITPEADGKFKTSKDVRYKQSKTSFIYRVEKETGKEDMFLMTIVPDVSYLESTEFKPFEKMSYLTRDKAFSGFIFYHNVEGEFVTGYSYKDGKVKGKIKAHSEQRDFNVVSTRSGSGDDCTDWYLLFLIENCYYWVVNEVLVLDYCYYYGYYYY